MRVVLMNYKLLNAFRAIVKRVCLSHPFLYESFRLSQRVVSSIIVIFLEFDMRCTTMIFLIYSAWQ